MLIRAVTLAVSLASTLALANPPLPSEAEPRSEANVNDPRSVPPPTPPKVAAAAKDFALNETRRKGSPIAALVAKAREGAGGRFLGTAVRVVEVGEEGSATRHFLAVVSVKESHTEGSQVKPLLGFAVSCSNSACSAGNQVDLNFLIP